MLTNFINALGETHLANFRVTAMANGKEAIQQTERNALKSSLIKALFEDIAKVYPTDGSNNDIVAYPIDGDIVIEVPNASIADKITNVEGSGAISISLAIKINGLEYDARNAYDDYQSKVAEKLAKKKAEAEKKSRKIAKDKAEREAKARAKAEG